MTGLPGIACSVPADQLERFRAGALRGAERLRVLEHLISGCPACRQGVGALETEAAGDAAVAGPFGESVQRLLERAARAELERAEAAALLGPYLAHPPARQRTLARNSARYATWSFVDRLIDTAFRRILDDPRATVELCEQALELTERIEPDCYGPRLLRDLEARAAAHLGNARRALGELRAGRELLERAKLAAGEGSLDPLLEAELLYLEASLLRAERNLPAALRKVRRSRRIYRELEDRHRDGISALNECSILHVAGNYEDALTVARFAVDAIDVERDPQLALAARHNLVWALMEVDRAAEALATLEAVRLDYETIGDHTSNLRRSWLEARLFDRLGRSADAGQAFETAIEGFAEAELPYEVASASLDYALMLFDSGQPEAVTDLAGKVLEIFRGLGIERESYAAWLIFYRSAAASALTRALVEKLMTHFRKARLHPDSAFET